MVKERRRRSRHHLGRLAAMYLGDGQPPRYCLIDDFSEGGVQISGYGFWIPDEFVLRFAGGERVKNGIYKVIWRREHIVGAKFVTPSRSEGAKTRPMMDTAGE
jgi:hypothetical protein